MRCYTNLNPMQVLYSYPIKFYYSHPIKISTHVFYSSTQVFYSFRKMSLKQWAQNQKKSITSEKWGQKVNSTKTSHSHSINTINWTLLFYDNFSSNPLSLAFSHQTYSFVFSHETYYIYSLHILLFFSFSSSDRFLEYSCDSFCRLVLLKDIIPLLFALPSQKWYLFLLVSNLFLSFFIIAVFHLYITACQKMYKYFFQLEH